MRNRFNHGVAGTLGTKMIYFLQIMEQSFKLLKSENTNILYLFLNLTIPRAVVCLQKAAGNGDVLHPVPSLIAALANPANPTKGRPESIPVFLS